MRVLMIFFSLVTVCGCDCGGEMGEQTLNLKAAGLWLTANPLDAPPGALSKAGNAVIRRPGVVEPRRGEAPDTQIDATVQEMSAFEGSVLAHGDDGHVYVRDGVGSFIDVGGPFTSPTGHPMRFAEAGGGLYLTTTTGPQRMDTASSNPVPAGTPPGLEGSATTTGASGWLANGDSTAYRFVWGSRDGDGALLLGAPSGRILLTNTSGGTRDVALTAPIPDGIVQGTHFLQVYRTVITTTSPVDPGEDMAQVAEVFPTAAQLAAGVVTYTDIASFANGPSAYFSPSVGAGLADAKEQPGLLTDALNFKGYLFGVIDGYRQTLVMSLLGIGGTTGLADSDHLRFLVGGTEIFELTATPIEDATQGYFKRFTGGTVAENIENTVRSLVRVANGFADSIVYAYYASGADDPPGKFLLTARDLDVGQITVQAAPNPIPWTPTLGARLEVTAITRTGTDVEATVNPIAAAAVLAVGQTINLSSVSPLPEDPDFPFGIKTITALDLITGVFTYSEAGPATSGTKDVYLFETTYADATFDQEAVPGSWAHSAFEEPDAWPPRFRYQVGGPNTRLDRITSQGEALLFWTSDGLYRLTGDNEDNFTLRPLDPTINLVGQSTPVGMGNRGFALTTQGVVAVTDIGVEKVSTPVDLALLPYYGSTTTNRTITDSAFGLAYQSENEYWLFLPDLATASPGDPPSLAYVYNTQTGTWVGPETFVWSGINSPGGAVPAGVVNPSDNFLYLGAANWIARERKDRALSDYQDSNGVGIPFDVAYQVQTARNPGALKQWSEVACLLEAPQPSAVELYFATELDSTEEGGTIPSQGNVAVRTYTPLNKSRSARLTVGLRHSTAQEKPSVLGLSVVYNTSSTRVGR